MAWNFANSIKETKNAKLISIASLEKKRLDNFKKKLNIKPKNCFKNYEDLIKSKEIDAIYISTLNNKHLDLIIKCSENKKNILCEKPITLNLEETEAASKHVLKNKVMCFEAIAYKAHPQTYEVKNLVAQNHIGEITDIKTSFGFKVKKIDPKSRLFNPDFGGGSLLDLGCYPLSFLEIFEKSDNNIQFISTKGGFSKTGVDNYAEAKVKLNNNINCEIKVSFIEDLDNKTIINGTKGKIIIYNSWLPSKKNYIDIFDGKSLYKKFITSNLSVYANQTNMVSDVFKNGIYNNEFLIDIKKSYKIMKNLTLWKKLIIKNHNG